MYVYDRAQDAYDKTPIYRLSLTERCTSGPWYCWPWVWLLGTAAIGGAALGTYLALRPPPFTGCTAGQWNSGFEECTRCDCPPGTYIDTSACDGNTTFDPGACLACSDCPAGSWFNTGPLPSAVLACLFVSVCVGMYMCESVCALCACMRACFTNYVLVCVRVCVCVHILLFASAYWSVYIFAFEEQVLRSSIHRMSNTAVTMVPRNIYQELPCFACL